ncbi:UvrD-helicase domain-containing protein [Priestia filamentosa]|uniref:ATP-dependent helicase n=1 Tax=Priestia filamentosa TaxID=1402861 RepID=UPI00397CC97B
MLNTQQQKAVEHAYGPLLIIAGAGSGKTTVLIERIKNMMEVYNIKASEILAVTFTNKAAAEMKERLQKKVGEGLTNGLSMSTFHSFCNRLLKKEFNNVENANFTGDFEVADENLVRAYIKQIVKGKTKTQPKTFADYISALKNELVTAKMFVEEDFSKEFIDSEKVEVMVSSWYADNPEHMELLGMVYTEYEKIMRKTNSLDFDDLIMQTVNLFIENPAVLDKYQERYKYILIDEYQDTNRAQYILSKLLADKYRNIAVVGDDAQSIYAFRGSDIRNILNFDFDYSDAEVIKLEQNYRSTKTIIQAANEVIAHNRNQKKKTLFTENEQGKNIVLLDCAYPDEEASMVASKIIELMKEGRSYSDFTILYRANRQSARVEQALRFENIPYFIYSGRSFFDIPEINIIVKYLQFIHNPNNIEAFNKIIQYPKRRIGEKTIEKIMAEFLNRSIVDILEDPSGIVRMQKVGKTEAQEFVSLIRDMQLLALNTPVHELIDDLIRKLDFKNAILPALDKSDTQEALKNIEMLIEMLVSKQIKEDRDIFIKEFIEEIALGSPKERPEDDDHVKLMTIHASKGLEFPVVFVINMQENAFPNTMFKEDYTITELEEERRLAYVAITRAREELYFSKHNYLITKKGDSISLTPSVFLNEFNRKLLTIEYL